LTIVEVSWRGPQAIRIQNSTIVNRQSEAGMEKSESANFGNSGLKLALMGQATEQS
jgi:hypothetical protein